MTRASVARLSEADRRGAVAEALKIARAPLARDVRLEAARYGRRASA